MEKGKEAQMWDGERWVLALLRGSAASGVLCRSTLYSVTQEATLEGNKRSFKVVAGAGCFFLLTLTAAQSSLPMCQVLEAMLPGGASSSSLHPTASTEERQNVLSARCCQERLKMVFDSPSSPRLKLEMPSAFLVMLAKAQ